MNAPASIAWSLYNFTSRFGRPVYYPILIQKAFSYIFIFFLLFKARRFPPHSADHRAVISAGHGIREKLLLFFFSPCYPHSALRDQPELSLSKLMNQEARFIARKFELSFWPRGVEVNKLAKYFEISECRTKELFFSSTFFLLYI